MQILNEGIFDLLVNASGWQYYALLSATALVVAVISYVLGSISSAVLISKLVYKEDIRSHGSGNAGMTNMLRTYGMGAAVMTLVGDLLKTVISVLFAALIFGFNYNGAVSLNGICYLAGSCAVLGHVYPIFHEFKGGKGVLVTASMMLVLAPPVFGILIFLFIALVAIFGYVSLGSICAAGLLPLALGLYSYFVGGELGWLTVVCTLFIGIFIIWCHRSNIKRLREGTEKKISIGKKEK